jgi:hypothetical protein
MNRRNVTVLTLPLLAAAFLTMAFGQPPGGGGGVSLWGIQTPLWNDLYSVNASVGCAGTADQTEHAYTVEIRNAQEIMQGSASGLSSSSQPATWACTVSRSGPWNTGFHKVVLRVDTEIEDERNFYFISI